MPYTTPTSTRPLTAPPDLTGLGLPAVLQACAEYAQWCVERSRQHVKERAQREQGEQWNGLTWWQRWGPQQRRRPWLWASALITIMVYAGLAVWMREGLSWERGNLAWTWVTLLTIAPLALWAWALRPLHGSQAQEHHRAALRRWTQQAHTHASDMTRMEAIYQMQVFANGRYGKALSAQTFMTLLNVWDQVVLKHVETPDAAVAATRTALARAIARVAHVDNGVLWLHHQEVLKTVRVNASGWDAHQVNWSGLTWSHARFAGANLSHAQLAGVHWPQADLRAADLTYSEMYGAHWVAADLTGARLCRSHLPGANLKAAKLRGVDISHAECVATQLSEVEAEASIWNHSDLTYANLAGAQLQGAQMRHARMRHANLKEADLRDVDMSQADLRGANCVDAVINARTRLDGVRIDHRTQFGVIDPEGRCVEATEERARWRQLGAIEADDAGWAQAA